MLLGGLFISTCSYAQAKQTIRWLGWEQVPNFIIKGEFKGQGIGDSFTSWLQQALPQYHHENVISNTRRYNLLIREENVCVAWAWIVPGSKEFREHSRPVSLAPGSGIHVLKSKQHLFGEPGEILTLAKLLANPNIKLGFLAGMTYSKKVHQLLNQYKGQPNVHYSSRHAVEFDLKLLDRNRLDYFFGFSSQSIANAKINGIKNKYQFYNLKEMDVYTSMHTHCSKTPFGKSVMQKLNRVITNKLLMKHLEVIEKWNGKNKQYRQVFMQHVINQQPSKQVSDPGQ